MNNTRSMWLFTLPSFGLLTCVLLWPFFYAVYLSLFAYDLGSGKATFIGLGNYIDLLSQDRFWTSLWTTLDRRKRQQTAALPGILATAGEFTKVA